MKPIYYIILVLLLILGAFAITVYVKNQERKRAEELQAAKEGRTKYIVGESTNIITSIIKAFSRD